MKALLDEFKKYLSQPLFLFAMLLLCLLPSLFLSFRYFLKLQTYKNLEEQIVSLHGKSAALKFGSQNEDYFLKKLKNADPYYIDKYLENLIFLESSIKKLQAGDSLDEKSRKRVKFLKEGSNHLRFSQQSRKQVKGVQETEEILQHAVEMHSEDLKKVLARIEEVQIGNYLPGENPPQLIIKNFELTKKTLNEKEEIYLVNLSLIKRESIHE